MTALDRTCQSIVTNVEGAVSCGVVDLDSGMLMGIHNASKYPEHLNDLVSAATKDMFAGPNITAIEQLVRGHRGVKENSERYFQEILVLSNHNLHLMKAIKGGRAAVVLVTRKDTLVARAWHSLKAHVEDIEAHL